MFAGLLLTAGVAYVTTSSTSLMATVESLWLPLLIGQFILAMAIQGPSTRSPRR